MTIDEKLEILQLKQLKLVSMIEQALTENDLDTFFSLVIAEQIIQDEINCIKGEDKEKQYGTVIWIIALNLFYFLSILNPILPESKSKPHLESSIYFSQPLETLTISTKNVTSFREPWVLPSTYELNPKCAIGVPAVPKTVMGTVVLAKHKKSLIKRFTFSFVSSKSIFRKAKISFKKKSDKKNNFVCSRLVCQQISEKNWVPFVNSDNQFLVFGNRDLVVVPVRNINRFSATLSGDENPEENPYSRDELNLMLGFFSNKKISTPDFSQLNQIDQDISNILFGDYFNDDYPFKIRKKIYEVINNFSPAELSPRNKNLYQALINQFENIILDGINVMGDSYYCDDNASIHPLQVEYLEGGETCILLREVLIMLYQMVQTLGIDINIDPLPSQNNTEENRNLNAVILQNVVSRFDSLTSPSLMIFENQETMRQQRNVRRFNKKNKTLSRIDEESNLYFDLGDVMYHFPFQLETGLTLNQGRRIRLDLITTLIFIFISSNFRNYFQNECQYHYENIPTSIVYNLFSVEDNELMNSRQVNNSRDWIFFALLLRTLGSLYQT